MLKKSLALITVVFYQLCYGQEQFPKNYFRSPIDTTIILAGNFAELRPNHFHTGLDIKTSNKEGMPIHAVADGYVSRIKVSSFGYGRVLYVTHPNGFVSVYAHLSAYNNTIGAMVKQQQYAQKTFEIELFPKPGELPVKQGEVIALSGNTGHSSGPHLHFEIRDEKTEKAINPLLFTLTVKDNVKPQLTKIKIFPADANALINGSNKAVEYSVTSAKQGFKLAIADTITVSGNIYFGFEGFDTESIRGGKNGIYSADIQVNNNRIYYYEMNKVGFDETRCINTFTDYPTYVRAGKFIQRSYVEPNNKLGVYKDVVNKGISEFKTDGVYHVKYILKDVYGNSSSLEFPVRSKSNTISPVKPGSAKLLNCREANKFATEDFQIELPANILYDDVEFKYSNTKTNIPGCYSDTWHVLTPDIPVNDFFIISIKPLTVDDSLKKHLVIARINKNNKKEFVGGEWQNGTVTAKAKEFGNFVITADTIAPTIKPVNIGPGKNISHQKSIELKISDNFSGIKNFEGFIDNMWILMEYEHKQNKLYYTIDTTTEYPPFRTESSSFVFKLNVTDNAGNTRTYTTTLVK